MKEFTDALVKAGQRVEYVQVGGAGHAFFDWKPDDAHQGHLRAVRRLLRRCDAGVLHVRSGPTPGEHGMGGQDLHVVLVHPEIHWNTGNAGRTCLAAGATLHLIEPLGFSLDEREVRRAGLDYWEHVDLRVWPGWHGVRSSAARARRTVTSSPRRRRRPYWDAPLGVRAVRC